MFDVTNFSEIIKYDQLYQEMQRNRVFLNYTEGAINFRPTYKYDPGTDEWDSRYSTFVSIKFIKCRCCCVLYTNFILLKQ